MRAAERGFDASGEQGQAGECLADQPRVDDDGAVGARSGFAAGRVGVIVAFFAERRVVRQHGIQRPGAHPGEQAGAAHAGEVGDALARPSSFQRGWATMPTR